MSFNSLFNSLSNINNSLMLFSSVFSHHRLEQHLTSEIVFSPLFLLSSKLFHSLIVDSFYTALNSRNYSFTLCMDPTLLHLSLLITQQTVSHSQKSLRHLLHFLFMYSPPSLHTTILYTNP
jgi:hypothetical protein